MRQQGHGLVAVSCSGASLPDGTPTHAVDFSSAGLPPELLDGVDTVFHLAGIAHQRASERSYDQVNHRATLQLARDARVAGVRQFVFVSSVKAMGAPGADRPRDESDCTTPLDAYGLSKWRAECDLRAEFNGSDMAVTIVRPALVYGREARGNLALLDRGIRLGLPRPPEVGARSMIALADLVGLLQVAAVNPGTAVKTWIACDGQRYSTSRVYDLLRRRAGRKPATRWCPRWLWRVAASAHDLLFPATESIWDKLFATELYDNSAVCSELDWSPRFTMDDVLAVPNGAGKL